MADHSYIVIQDFMVTDLGLKGNELIIYACIYGFCQAEGQTFHGSLAYLGKWAGIKNRNNVIAPLKSLIDKGLITKYDRVINGVKFCEYAANYNGVMKNITGCYENHNGGCYENHNRGVMKSITNNIDNNINNTLKDNIVKAPVYFPNDEKLNDAFKSFVDMRKKIKAPMTDHAIDLAKNKLMQLAGNDNDAAIEIVDQSVLNGWKGFYPLKTGKTTMSEADAWLKA